jgi:membrane glycosyltransferase
MYPSLALNISHTAELVILVLATLILLYTPKFLAVIALLSDATATRIHGGTRHVVFSVLWECLFSTLMAPIVMLQHSWYVFSILMGISTGWGSQQRTDRALPLAFAARQFAPHTLVGLGATIVLWNTHSFGWFVPLLAGLLLSIPLVILSSSPLLGRLSRIDKLFLVPSETRGLAVLDRAHALAAGHENLSQDARQLVLDNAQVRDLHLALLAGTPPPDDRHRLGILLDFARRRETAAFSRDDWALLLSDSESLKALGTVS